MRVKRSGPLEQMKLLADRMLSFKARGAHTFVHFTPRKVAPLEVLTKLRSSSLSDLVLPAGASLSISGEGDYFPDLNLTADDELLCDIGLTALGWEFSTDGDLKAAAWGREIDLSLWYGRDNQPGAKQVFSLQAYDRRPRLSIARDVWAFEYAETGYEGHNQRYRETSNAEARFFIELLSELFAATDQGKTLDNTAGLKSL